MLYPFELRAQRGLQSSNPFILHQLTDAVVRVAVLAPCTVFGATMPKSCPNCPGLPSSPELQRSYGMMPRFYGSS